MTDIIERLAAAKNGLKPKWLHDVLVDAGKEIAALRDSDGSGEAVETRSGSTEGDSAGRQASPTPTPETNHA